VLKKKKERVDDYLLDLRVNKNLLKHTKSTGHKKLLSLTVLQLRTLSKDILKKERSQAINRRKVFRE
jgi:hypothetical protein